jgi:hypothetical protein
MCEIRRLCAKGTCDIGLYPSYLKINRGHQIDMTNQYVKYEEFVIDSFQDDKPKPH